MKEEHIVASKKRWKKCSSAIADQILNEMHSSERSFAKRSRTRMVITLPANVLFAILQRTRETIPMNQQGPKCGDLTVN